MKDKEKNQMAKISRVFHMHMHKQSHAEETLQWKILEIKEYFNFSSDCLFVVVVKDNVTYFILNPLEIEKVKTHLLHLNALESNLLQLK